jgi:hypothetical protein
MVRKKTAKKSPGKTGRKKDDNLDIRLKVNNIEKLIKEGKKWDKESRKCHCGGGGFWVFGSAFAMIWSYSVNSSLGWAFLHGILSWFYIIYRLVLEIV